MEGKLTKLNEAQEKVIAHKSGPLMVVAGAGTGKTRVIIEKINKLLDDGVEPSAILAVTFTEKAAAEMLDRLLLNRQGFLLDMPITTFNGFGESLLREFGSHIGLGRNFRVLNEQAQIVFVRERISMLKLDYFLPLSDLPDSIIEDIVGVFSQLKQHIVTPETYLTWANTLPQSDEAEKLEKLKHQELATAYDAYMQMCRQENVIDFDDQIYQVLELLNKRPNVRQQLQERYHTLFIDEFQDTNPMQSRLIDLLAGKQHNVVVVGDDDQSIYGFRGATLANILEFKDRYPEAKEVALTQNYRSSQAILDAAYSLITNNNPNRLEATLKINKRLTSNQPGSAPQVMLFENLQVEFEWIARDIAARLQAGEEPGQIAVLARSRKTVQNVHQALERLGVAHQVIGYNEDLYKQPVVRMLIELCRTLAEPHNNSSLHHTLVSDLFGLTNDVISPFAAKARYEHESLEDLLAASEQPEILKSIALIKTLRESAASLSVSRLLFRAMEDSGYKDRLFRLAASDDEAAQTVSHLSQYLDTLKAFESIAIQPTAVAYLVSLPALQAAGETTDDTLSITNDEVCVLTIHKAKGLEWNTVYIPGCNEQAFPIKKQPKGLQMPEELKTATSSPADEHYAEERRLMYVAATRAKMNLVLTHSAKNKSGTLRRPSRFLSEMFGDKAVDSMAADKEAGGQTTLAELPEAIVPKVAIPSSIYDGKKFFLTVSQASELLNCPLNFYYKFILNAPEKPTPSTEYGSQLHAIFESINKDRIKGDLPPLEEYLTELKAGWSKGGYATKEQQERAFKQAVKTVTRFYEESKAGPKPLFVEENFVAELEPENIVLRGRYDAVMDFGSGPEIRDYKTSISVKSAEKAKSRAVASTQLTMYALAWQLSHGELPALLTLQFVDTNLTGSVRKTQKGIDGLRERLYKAVEELKTGSYPPGNRHDYCIHPTLGE